MLIYRLVWAKFAKDLSGEGASLNGGRWNNTGIPCIYTAESRALAVLEYSVNVTIESIPGHLNLITLKIPDEGHKIISINQLPDGWNRNDNPKAARNFGTAFLEKKDHLIIRIPSVVVPQEYNFLINPLHPDMKKVSIADVSDFSFDARLKK